MNLEQLATEAQGGNADAQFKYALTLLQSEQIEQAFYWLHKAGELKHIRAIELLGVLVLQGRGVKSDPALAFEYFRSAAMAGDAQALMRCAELMFSGKGVNQDRSGAISCLIESAKQGYPVALRTLGFFLLRHAEPEVARSAFRLAAYGGDPHSQYVTAKLCNSKSESSAWMAQAAQRGIYLAQKAKIDDAELADLAQLKGDLLAQLQALIPHLDAFVPLDETMPMKHVLSQQAEIAVAEQLLSGLEADYLINSSVGFLNPAKVVSHDATVELEQIRTGMTASLGQLLDVVVDWLVERICTAIDKPVCLAETPAVIRYLPGEMYKQHGDYLPDDSTLTDKANGGQRSHTALVYLNDDFAGGNTTFNLLNISVKPKQGQLLTFTNITSTGAGLELSQHTGEAVMSGEKWLLSIWFRQFEAEA